MIDDAYLPPDEYNGSISDAAAVSENMSWELLWSLGGYTRLLREVGVVPDC